MHKKKEQSLLLGGIMWSFADFLLFSCLLICSTISQCSNKTKWMNFHLQETIIKAKWLELTLTALKEKFPLDFWELEWVICLKAE